MAVFKVEMFKELAGENWANVYHVSADDISDLSGIGNSIFLTEKEFHLDVVTFTNARVSTIAEDDEIFSVQPINASGERASSDTPLPLFNTLRVDLQAGTGRPGRKYYRGVLMESDNLDVQGSIASGILGTVASELTALISGLSGTFPLQQADGDLIISATPFTKVQMRQLHRKRRRTPTP